VIFSSCSSLPAPSLTFRTSSDVSISPPDRLLAPVDEREKIVEAHVAGAGDEAVARGHQHLVLHAEFHPGAVLWSPPPA
jgi:hypothetical protein